MLAQTAQAVSLRTLVLFMGGLIVVLIVAFAAMRYARSWFTTSAPQRKRHAWGPDAWEESARRMPTPPADPDDDRSA